MKQQNLSKVQKSGGPENSTKPLDHAFDSYADYAPEDLKKFISF